MRGRMAALAAVAVVLMAEVAMAQALGPSALSTRTRHWDGRLFTKYQFGKTIDADGGSNVKVDDDFGWGFGFDYNLSEHIGLGADFGWNYINYDANVVAQNPANSFSYGNTADTGSALFNAMYYLLPKRMTPYVAGGIGWVWVNSNVVAGLVPGCYWDPWYGYICGYYPTTYGDDGTGYQLGAGIRYDAGRAFFLKLGYNHLWTDFGQDVTGFDSIRLDFGGMF
jgi:opacity protein-like surface antigen